MAEYERAKQAVATYRGGLKAAMGGDGDAFKGAVTNVFSQLGYGADAPADADYVGNFLAPYTKDMLEAVAAFEKQPEAALQGMAKAEPRVLSVFIGNYLGNLPAPEGFEIPDEVNRNLIAGANLEKITRELSGEE